MREDQRSRALRLIELFDAVPGEDWLDNAAALLRELAAERDPDAIDDMIDKARTIPALENCRLFAARHRKEEWAQTILRFCAEGGATGSPLRELAAEPERVPLTDEKFEEFIEQFRWYDGDVDRYDIQGFARELLRAHGITGDAK